MKPAKAVTCKSCIHHRQELVWSALSFCKPHKIETLFERERYCADWEATAVLPGYRTRKAA